MTDTILLTIPSDARFRGVATLVLGGIGTRLDLPYEQIDDLQLALSSLLEAGDGEFSVSIEFDAGDELISIAVGPLRKGTAEDGGLRRVLEPLVDSVRSDQREGGEWLVLELARSRPQSSPATE